MRDRATQRGRGFGFVLVSFTDEEGAKVGKNRILMVNSTEGHFILDKRVDVKSADDYTGKGQGPPMGGIDSMPMGNPGHPN
jgi:hypothetical protein